MKPTPKQLRLLKRLKRHGAPLPTTRAACSTLIGFLFYGQHSRQGSCSARLALFRRWTGAVVKVVRNGHPYRGRLGKVVGWRMIPRREIEAIRERYKVDPLPFMALVKLDRVDRSLAFSLSDLRVIAHGEQRLLFALSD